MNCLQKRLDEHLAPARIPVLCDKKLGPGNYTPIKLHLDKRVSLVDKCGIASPGAIAYRPAVFHWSSVRREVSSRWPLSVDPMPLEYLFYYCHPLFRVVAASP